MKLTVIGCSGSFPGPDSPASCYLVEAGETRVLLDLGSGALGALQRYVDIYRIDAVLLSHLHADHCLDLCGYYVARKYRPAGPAPRIPVFGPSGTAERLAHAYGDIQREHGMTEEFDVISWGPDAVPIGPLTVTVAPVEHPVESYAIRLEHDGRVLVYSGDTGPSPALVDIATGAAVFLCEASFQESGRPLPPGLHLTGRQAGEHAKAAGVGRLVLTHVPPWHDPARTLAEAQDAFPAAELAQPGASYVV